MSLFILDTDTLTLWRYSHPVVCQHVDAQLPVDLAVTVISVEEQLSGWYTRIRQARRRDELARAYQGLVDTVKAVGRLQVLSFTEPAMIRHDQLKALRLNVGKKDLCIAAIALEVG